MLMTHGGSFPFSSSAWWSFISLRPVSEGCWEDSDDSFVPVKDRNTAGCVSFNYDCVVLDFRSGNDNPFPVSENISNHDTDTIVETIARPRQKFTTSCSVAFMKRCAQLRDKAIQKNGNNLQVKRSK